jgi:hypothetical protein
MTSAKSNLIAMVQPPQNPPGPPQATPRDERPVPLLGSAFLILAGAILAVYYLNRLRKYGGRK